MSKAIPAPGTPVCANPARLRRKKTRLAPAQRDAAKEGPLDKHWRTYFLAALIETSNVTASAQKAGVSPGRAYKVRREDPGFAAQWSAALHEGYVNLEMEALGYLRSGDPDRKMDITAAIRLLTMHRESVARERALADNRSEQDVLDSIDAMIDEMRERAAANAVLLAEPETDGHREHDDLS